MSEFADRLKYVADPKSDFEVSHVAEGLFTIVLQRNASEHRLWHGMVGSGFVVCRCFVRYVCLDVHVSDLLLQCLQTNICICFCRRSSA